MRNSFSANPFSVAGAALYGIAAGMRSAGFDSGLIPVRKVNGIKSISVGNLRAGGSGKTPFAMQLAVFLRDCGVKTALSLRGYKGRLEACGGFASMGQGPLCPPADAGDEAYMAASRLEGVLVIVGSNRVLSAHRAVAAGARALVLDDGFQHRRLHRDLNILLVCPEDLNPSTRLLPAGPLREPPFQVRRADLTAGFESDWKEQEKKPDALFEYAPSSLVLENGQTLSLDSCAGARVFLLSGIARPDKFGQTAQSAGFAVAGRRAFKDHHRFGRRDIGAIDEEAQRSGAEAILTTEKDLARLVGAAFRLPLWALRIDIKIVSGLDLLKNKIDDIFPH